MNVPDDASSLLAEVELALVVTPVASVEALAATCAMAKIKIDAVPTEVGALAVLRESAGAGPAEGAGAISRLLRGVPLVLLERRAGQLAASRWLDGTRDGDLAPGLVLDDAPKVLEDLMLGATTPAEIDGVVSSVGMSRLRAMRVLASTVRANRHG